jgi:hypothetical protein
MGQLLSKLSPPNKADEQSWPSGQASPGLAHPRAAVPKIEQGMQADAELDPARGLNLTRGARDWATVTQCDGAKMCLDTHGRRRQGTEEAAGGGRRQKESSIARPRTETSGENKAGRPAS